MSGQAISVIVGAVASSIVTSVFASSDARKQRELEENLLRINNNTL